MDTRYKKIVICADSENIEEPVSSRFARCEYYALYNHEDLTFTFYKNEAKDEMSGAGGKAAKQVSEIGAEAVLVPEVGPKAYTALEAFDIDVYCYKKDSTVKDTIYDFYQKQLEQVFSSTKKGKH